MTRSVSPEPFTTSNCIRPATSSSRYCSGTTPNSPAGTTGAGAAVVEVTAVVVLARAVVGDDAPPPSPPQAHNSAPATIATSDPRVTCRTLPTCGVAGIRVAGLRIMGP